jgi:hypothetical protein
MKTSLTLSAITGSLVRLAKGITATVFIAPKSIFGSMYVSLVVAQAANRISDE